MVGCCYEHTFLVPLSLRQGDDGLMTYLCGYCGGELTGEAVLDGGVLYHNQAEANRAAAELNEQIAKSDDEADELKRKLAKKRR